MLGELERLNTYSKKGDIVSQEMPPEIASLTKR
jgi:hypothetical protein